MSWSDGSANPVLDRGFADRWILDCIRLLAIAIRMAETAGGRSHLCGRPRQRSGATRDDSAHSISAPDRESRPSAAVPVHRGTRHRLATHRVCARRQGQAVAREVGRGSPYRNLRHAAGVGTRILRRANSLPRRGRDLAAHTISAARKTASTNSIGSRRRDSS